MANMYLSNKLYYVISFSFIIGCSTKYRVPLVIYKKCENKDNVFVIARMDSICFSGNRYFIEICKYRKNKKNGMAYQYLYNKNDNNGILLELYRAGKYKDGRKKGVWNYYEKGKNVGREYWGKKFYRTTVKNKW